MAASGGGLSEEEFLIVQEQLIELRNRNYELQSELKKKSAELSAFQAQSPKNEALQFASKLISRSKDKAATERLESDLEGMRRKLIMQEEEFRLQQETLITELNKVVSQCGDQEKELVKLREQLKQNQNGILPHPLATETDIDNARKIVELEQEVIKLTSLLKEKEKCMPHRSTNCSTTSFADYSTPTAEHSNFNIENMAHLQGEILTMQEELAKEKEQSALLPKFQEENSILKSQNENLMKNMENVQEELVRVKDECSDLNRKISELVAVSSENKNLRDTISSIESDLLKSSDSNIDKDILLKALETQIVEYKNKVKEAQASQQNSEAEQCKLLTQLEEKDLKLQTLMADFETIRADIDQKSAEIAELKEQRKIISDECSSLLLKLDEAKRRKIDSEAELENLKKVTDDRDNEKDALLKEKSTLELEIAANQRQIEFLKKQVKEFEERITKQATDNNNAIHDVNEKISFLKAEHQNDLQKAVEKHTEELEKLKQENCALAERHEFDMVAKEEMHNERMKLELSHSEKSFMLEKAELERKIESLEEVLKGKDHEKTIALKKQSALVKELKRSLAEERKRSEGIERAQTVQCAQNAGWTVVSDPDMRSTNTFDGNESVSSLSVLESDNVELISRLTKMQKDHAETIDRLNEMETEAHRLRQEVHEKNELIEHWIRSRPADRDEKQSTSVGANLRKFISATIADESAYDIRETNKKLQRMLEETLSKNISLQRDLQTLLERTEL